MLEFKQVSDREFKKILIERKAYVPGVFPDLDALGEVSSSSFYRDSRDPTVVEGFFREQFAVTSDEHLREIAKGVGILIPSSFYWESRDKQFITSMAKGLGMSLQTYGEVVRGGRGEIEYEDSEVSLTTLADLINATQSDLHYLHFYAGAGGFWDRIHDICGDYYVRLAEDYDDVAELCLQLDMDISHPNDSALALGFKNSAGSLGDTFTYDSVMQIVQDRFHNILDCAVEVLGRYQGNDAGSTAVRNYLEGFVQEWSKEVDYKIKERLGGEKDRGGAYRDRVSGEQLIAGDMEDVGGFGEYGS